MSRTVERVRPLSQNLRPLLLDLGLRNLSLERGQDDPTRRRFQVRGPRRVPSERSDYYGPDNQPPRFELPETRESQRQKRKITGKFFATEAFQTDSSCLL